MVMVTDHQRHSYCCGDDTRLYEPASRLPDTAIRRLKAYKHLPVLRAALLRPQQAVLADQAIDRQSRAA
jgi:hypothetical protein